MSGRRVRRVLAASLVGLAATAGIAGATTRPGAVSLGASATGATPYPACPAGHRLIHGHTRWHRRRLAPGVSVSAAELRDRTGTVAVHVVRADLRRPGVALSPLLHGLDDDRRLTSLAGADRSIVAATNAMYFDPHGGSPLAPLIVDGRPLVATRAPRPVVGTGIGGRMQAGTVALTAAAVLTDEFVPVIRTNPARPRPGLSVYTPAWGRHRLPLSAHTISRRLEASGTLGPVRAVHHATAGPVLVASGPVARRRLAAAADGAGAGVFGRTTSSTGVPFSQAFGVGTHLVARPRRPRRHLYCRADALFVPRTAIGWSAGGRELLLVTVTVARGTHEHGVDENQMAYLLAELGAQQAYALDGGGSTELVTRRAGGRLSIDGGGTPQRRIPVAVGVTWTPPGARRAAGRRR